jgi:multidrug efflux pump subunit AcrB
MSTQNNNFEKIIEKEKHTIFGFFVTKFRLVYLILATVILLGGFSVLTMPREADPEVKIPFASVTTIFPGATPTDVEELVTDKIEAAIKSLENLRRYTSSSSTGVSSIFVEFEADADLAESVRKLNNAVDRAQSELPEDAEDSAVIEARANDFPIVTYSLVGEYSHSELKEFADIIQDQLEGIRDVSKVPILGSLEREFQVIVDPTRLENFGVSLGQIVASISRANINLPAGNIEVDGFNYNVRVQGRFNAATQLDDVVVSTVENTPIYVSDVALVFDTFKEKTTESRIGFPGQAASNTISLQVFKKTGGNILNIVDESQVVVQELQTNGALPNELTIEKTNDNAVFIRDDLNTLGRSGIQTMVLIFVLLALVIGFRASIITSLSVPIAFLMAFIVLSITGMTLNGIVLFALVLSLGLMVDNSIVIIEGINEYMEKHNMSAFDAALMSIWTYRWPITAGTLTTISAFLPMLLVSGILGEFLSFMPKTITWTLLSSLFVALIVLPTLISRVLKNGRNNGAGKNRVKHGLFHKLIETKKATYERYLKNLLPNKKRRRKAIALAWGLFLISLAMPILGVMKVEMFPPVDLDYFVINVELPQGSTLEKTDMLTTQVEKIVSELPELENYVTNLGTSASLGLTGDFISTASNNEHLAAITVNLVDEDERDRKSFEVAESIREPLVAIEGGTVRVQELSAGPPTGAPIEMRITGDNLEELAQTANKIVKTLETISGVINVQDSVVDTTGEFTFTIDKQKANFYGLDVAAVASTLRSIVFGAKASAVTLAGEDVDITVKYDPDTLTDISKLANLTLVSPNGNTIPLNQVATVSLEPSLASINHRDGERVVTVRADVVEGFNVGIALQEFEEQRPELNIPESAAIEIGGEVEDIQQSFTETFYSMIVAVLLILVILVLQFNSFRQPFIILFTLPLATIGVILGLMITGQPFSFPAFIGIVALSGIVVNDAIVLIDKINKNLGSGMEYIEAIIDGGSARIQPILLTTLTTIAGIFPLVYANELWRGLSITVIFGLLFATILTLVMVPILYTGFAHKEVLERQQGQM